MQVDRRGTRVAALVGIASLSLLVSACGGSNSAAPSTARAKPTTTTGGAPAATTIDPTTAAVLQAYRAGWAAFEHALADANPEDPELTATMVAPQLTGVRASLAADQQQGMVGRGTFTLHPKIASLSATTATVVDCAYSTSVLIYAKTDKPVPPITPPENDGVQSELVLTGGVWKVYKQTVTDGKCAPGS
jgi:ABC-type transport system substrate-binding protein